MNELVGRIPDEPNLGTQGHKGSTSHAYQFRERQMLDEAKGTRVMR